MCEFVLQTVFEYLYIWKWLTASVQHCYCITRSFIIYLGLSYQITKWSIEWPVALTVNRLSRQTVEAITDRSRQLRRITFSFWIIFIGSNWTSFDLLTSISFLVSFVVSFLRWRWSTTWNCYTIITYSILYTCSSLVKIVYWRSRRYWSLASTWRFVRSSWAWSWSMSTRN